MGVESKSHSSGNYSWSVTVTKQCYASLVGGKVYKKKVERCSVKFWGIKGIIVFYASGVRLITL